jgi:hypothetical protein
MNPAKVARMMLCAPLLFSHAMNFFIEGLRGRVKTKTPFRPAKDERAPGLPWYHLDSASPPALRD